MSSPPFHHGSVHAHENTEETVEKIAGDLLLDPIRMDTQDEHAGPAVTFKTETRPAFSALQSTRSTGPGTPMTVSAPLICVVPHCSTGKLPKLNQYELAP